MSFFDLLREREIEIRVRPGWKLGKSGDGKSFVASSARYGVSPPVGRYAAAFEPANEKLHAGAPLGALRDAAIAADGPSRAASYLVFLQSLARWGLIEFPLVDAGGVRAVALAQLDGEVPALAPEAPPAEAALRRFACLRREDGAWLLEAPLTGLRFMFSDLAALDAPVVRRALAAAGFLEGTAPESDARREALEQWEFHDLMFHGHSRRGWHNDPFGAVFPYIGRLDPPPAIRPPWPGARIGLPRAPNEPAREPFADVLDRRRSERVYDETRPIALRDLGALLDRAARVRSQRTIEFGNYTGQMAEFEITRRPYPNGGASYELEIYVISDRCADLGSGLYHYDAGAHELVRITDRTPEVERILGDARVATGNQADPQIVLAIAARFARVMWKYKSIAYAVILRNAGALYQTLYLAATELGLSPCGLGSGNSANFARATGLDPAIEGTVGEFILGGPPDPGAPTVP